MHPIPTILSIQLQILRNIILTTNIIGGVETSEFFGEGGNYEYEEDSLNDKLLHIIRMS